MPPEAIRFIVIAVVVQAVIFGVFGWYVGRTKGRPWLGAVLGAVAGITGLLVIALIPPTPEIKVANEITLARNRARAAWPPGWYADPSGENEKRYWDGAAWSQWISNQLQVQADGGWPHAEGSD